MTGKVEADDPARNRCGCFLPDLTRLATAPSADFRAGIWVNSVTLASPPTASSTVHAPEKSSECSRRSPHMPLPALIVPILLSVAVVEDPPITVRAYPWAPFVSPMGEPFRGGSTRDAPIARWFARADGNRDGTLTADEMQVDSDRFFMR